MLSLRMFFSLALITAIHGIAYFLWRLYRHRSRIHELRKQGMPLPEGWSWIYGHILLLYRITSTQLPPYSNVNNIWPILAAQFPDEEMFLLDVWPVDSPIVLVFNPEAAAYVAQQENFPKPRTLEEMMMPITGGPSMLSMNGEAWKTWRNLFNPGFSTGVMTEQIPTIVDSVEVFCQKLRVRAGKGLVFLDELTSRLTFEVILKVVLDKDADHQRRDHILGRALGKIIQWHSFWDMRIILNPLRPFVQSYYGRVITRYLLTELKERVHQVRQEQLQPDSSTQSQSKSVMSLAINSLISEKGGEEQGNVDDAFLTRATHQIRLFLLAGNDTTSSAMVFIYHMLSKHPEVLATMTKEHDDIFGTDATEAVTRLKAQPSLVHHCTYTLAVIKETLRLFPPASALRDGSGGTITSRNGLSFSTDRLAVILSHITMQRTQRLWPRPMEFLPERWLAGPEHTLYPPKNAYRPFELGPRNCIGQTLSMNEMKVLLIMTARMFEIKPAYEEFDALQEQSPGVFQRALRYIGVGESQVKTLDGDRAFQTEKAGAHPSDGYPCHIELRSTS